MATLLYEKEAEEYYYKKVFAETNPKNETELKEKFLQTFKDGAEFGYRKANEWNTDSPSDAVGNKDLLLQVAEDDFETGYYSFENNRFYTMDGKEVEVLCWKVIVSPEVSE